MSLFAHSVTATVVLSNMFFSFNRQVSVADAGEKPAYPHVSSLAGSQQFVSTF